jgi:hypothetical protein
VTVRHNDVAQPLANGATVEGEDVIETGADGNVVIELSHNLARWELGANQTSKVRESSAWSLAKKTGSVAAVEQNSAAAGRPAERSAAETSVSAPREETRAAEAAPAQAAPPPAAAATPAPPPPPPPKPPRAQQAKGAPPDDTMDMPSGGGGGATDRLEKNLAVSGDVGVRAGGTRGRTESAVVEAKKAPPPDSDKQATLTPAQADKAATDLVLANEKSLKACLTKDAQAVSITIKVNASGVATAVVTAKAAVPAGVTKCIKAAVAKLKFEKAATTVSLQLER